MVGAGLAGLSAAVRLEAAGCDVHVLDAGAHAGGRLATERIDGFLVDRGFQVLNTGYPRAADLDLDALDSAGSSAGPWCGSTAAPTGWSTPAGGRAPSRHAERADGWPLREGGGRGVLSAPRVRPGRGC